MEHFNWSLFTRRIAVKATLPQKYAAWTTAEEIEKWFLSSAEFSDEQGCLIDRNQHILKGMNYTWRWYTYEPAETGSIMDTNGKDFLQFSFAGDCLVTVKLCELADHTIVESTQSNIPEDENSKQSIRLGCDTGWCFYLVNLKSVYEGGLDLRNKNEAFKQVVNS